MIARLIPEGGYIPRWWAVAYRDFDRDAKVAYPIPLHWLVRWARDLLFWIKMVGRPSYRETIEQKAYRKGHEQGFDAAARLYGRLNTQDK